MRTLFANNVLDVLSVFFLHQEEIHQAKIAQLTGLRKLQVQRAIQRIRESGLIEESKRGNLVCYKLIESHPVFSDLKNILYKTVLIAEPFKNVLDDEVQRVQLAFIYGSFATRTEHAGSDIDLFVIGNIGLKKLSSKISSLSEKLQREVNPIIYTNNEFVRKAKLNDHFISAILQSEKLWLIGSDNELRKILKRK